MITYHRIFAVALGAVLGFSAPAAATSAAKSSSQDAAIFRAGLLTAKDLPAGFTSNGPGQGAHRPDTSGYANPLPACGTVYPELAKSAGATLQASSEDFVTRTKSAESYGTVRVYKDKKTAGTYVRLLSSSEFLGCFRSVEQAQATSDSTATSTESRVVSQLAKLAKLGDQVTGLRVVTTLSGQAPPNTFATDYYYVRAGRAVVYLVFANTSKPLPHSVRVVRTVVARVARAQK